MKKTLQILGIAAGVLAAGTTFGSGDAAASSIQPVLSGTAHQALFSIALDGKDGLAVGAGGALLQSGDSGKTWSAVTPAPTQLSLMGADIQQGHELAVGQLGLILVRGADGIWTKTDSGTDKRLFSVSVNADGLAAVVGAFGTVLKSQDGGKTWTSIAPDWSKNYAPDGAQPHLYAVEVDDKGTITMAGEFGLILRSTDGGANWQVLHKGDASLFALDIRADGVGYAVGQSGTIARTADHGQTWSTMMVDGRAILLGVSSSADGRTVITGMHDMLVSNDDGRTFRHLINPEVATSWYQGIARSGPDSPVFAVGHSGQIIRIDG
ncbi:MAG: WD40/YVTN/BNR-like repeat-containing protein [Stenotrophobium sp.]